MSAYRDQKEAQARKSKIPYVKHIPKGDRRKLGISGDGNPSKEMQGHLQMMGGGHGGSVPIIKGGGTTKKASKGGLRLTGSPFGPKRKGRKSSRIRPDVMRVFGKATQAQVKMYIKHASPDERKSLNTLMKKKNFRQVLKKINIPITRGVLVKKLRVPDRITRPNK